MSRLVQASVLSWAIALVAVPHLFQALSSPVPTPTTQLISSRKPDGLILSTGNLYFTSHDGVGAAVWRMAQTDTPGQERILYWEAGAIFGDIVFAEVNGSFFGYFFAQRGGVTTIRRIPLEGGSATVLATVTNVDVSNSHRNLITDGLNLYWQDVNSVRKMPIGGGVATILDQTTASTPTAGLAMQGKNIIYASVAAIRFVPKGGAFTVPQARTIVTGSSRVTSLYAVSNGVYWGEQSGAVRVKAGAATTTLPSVSGFVPTSISTNGSSVGGSQAWTQCASVSCYLFFPATSSSQAIAADALGITVTSSASVFWGDAGGVHRQAL
jgi:hypothetical protein